MKKFTAKCGGSIALTPAGESHLAAHPEAAALLEEAIAKIVLPEGGFLLTTVQFDRVVGKNACVEVPASAPALFAVSLGRDVPTRVVVGVEKPPTRLFTVIASRKGGGEGWSLITGFTGPAAPREPHDRAFADPAATGEFQEALAFWSTHVLVWEESIMAPPYESTWEAELAKVAARRAVDK